MQSSDTQSLFEQSKVDGSSGKSLLECYLVAHLQEKLLVQPVRLGDHCRPLPGPPVLCFQGHPQALERGDGKALIETMPAELSLQGSADGIEHLDRQFIGFVLGLTLPVNDAVDLLRSVDQRGFFFGIVEFFESFSYIILNQADLLVRGKARWLLPKPGLHAVDIAVIPGCVHPLHWLETRPPPARTASCWHSGHRYHAPSRPCCGW
ncbi:hypothetical protein SDC9_168454 [bioreactor metagenome]|uniref:Uncharacterized protein n=1 Tax=bioreactor metagenome TaxID=1076179 RepID=A0A645G363_9ZZZZ